MRIVLVYVPTMILGGFMTGNRDYRFEFAMALPYKGQGSLVMGQLVLRHLGKVRDTWIVTSGCIGHQYHGSFTAKGKGPLPPSTRVLGGMYQVATKGIFLGQTKGVEGMFYPITPFEVNLGVVKRGDFGIHFDANVPGSAGCIVVKNRKPWNELEEFMEYAHTHQGINSIPLLVDYPLPKGGAKGSG